MKERSWLISIGVVIYILLSGVNRFIYKVPNYIYIPIAIIAIVFILVGFIKDRNKYNK